MKRRIRPQKILAITPVLVVAAMGCAREPETVPQVATPEVAVAPERHSAPVIQPVVAQPEIEPAPAPLDESALMGLRGELSTAGRDGAMKDPKHFRPLCDKEGYPLVGNMVRKVPGEQYQPSAFCAELRTAGKL
jgi:hypothetical protein